MRESTSESRQNGATGSRFTFLPETIKPDQIYKTTVFQTMDIRKWRTVIPKRQDTNEVSPMNSPDYCFEGIIQVRSQFREGNPGRVWQTPRLEDRVESPWRPGSLVSLEQSTREQRAAEDPGDLQTVLLEQPAEYQLVYVYEEMSQEWGMSHSKGL